MARIELVLPFPPSVNAIWRAGRNWRAAKTHVYRSKKYTGWIKYADAEFLRQKQSLECKHIPGKFTARLLLTPGDKRRRDPDNYNKVVLDFAKRAGLIVDDSLCRRITTEFVDEPTPENPPRTCRLILESI